MSLNPVPSCDLIHTIDIRSQPTTGTAYQTKYAGVRCKGRERIVRVAGADNRLAEVMEFQFVGNWPIGSSTSGVPVLTTDRVFWLDRKQDDGSPLELNVVTFRDPNGRRERWEIIANLESGGG